MMKEGFTKIVNFMTPGAGILLLGQQMSYSENALFLLKSFYNTTITDIYHAHFLICSTFPVSTATVNHLSFTIRVQVYCDFVGILYVHVYFDN